MHFLGLVMPANPLPNLETSPVLLSASDISIFIMLKRILLWKHEHWYPSSMIAISKIRGVLISIKGKGVAVKNIAIISAGLAVLTLVLLLPTKVTVCIYLIRITLPKTMQRSGIWRTRKEPINTTQIYYQVIHLVKSEYRNIISNLVQMERVFMVQLGADHGPLIWYVSISSVLVSKGRHKAVTEVTRIFDLRPKSCRTGFWVGK